jgi:hypothetical protein
VTREFGITGTDYRKIIEYLRVFGIVVEVAVEGTSSDGGRTGARFASCRHDRSRSWPTRRACTPSAR